MHVQQRQPPGKAFRPWAKLITATLVVVVLALITERWRQGYRPTLVAAEQPPPPHLSSRGAPPGSRVPELLTYRIVRELLHDPSARTQGLQFERYCPDGPGSCREIFWESTGFWDNSSVREVDVETGRVLRQAQVARGKQEFGEGMARIGDRLYLLTMRSPNAWSISVANFSEQQLVQSPLRDGWGVTTDGRHLVVSNSSEILTWIDPDTMQVVRSVHVTDAGEGVPWLNELEWVDGQVLGNIWLSECIARVDPTTGAVTAWVQLQGLRHTLYTGLGLEPEDAVNDVLNGIAWDEKGRRLFITGKRWPRVYQVELVPLETEDSGAALQYMRQVCIKRDLSPYAW